MLLVLIFLSIFLNIRLAFWVAFSIPISFLGMLIFAGQFDITINLMSLFGMIVVIGILVEDSAENGREFIQKNNISWDTSLTMMRNNNPLIIPRNHQVERVINSATQGDLKCFRDFLEVLENPYKADGKSKPYQMPPEPRERVYQTFCGT